MTVIRNNSISGINSITAQSGALNFYDSTGNTLSIGADVTGGVTVATGATISGSTNTIVASTNGSERLRITSTGNVGIGTNNPGYKVHVEGTGEVFLNVVGDVAPAGGGANLRLQNRNTTASALNQIQSADAGGQTTSAISFYNVDNTTNEGYIMFLTRPSGGGPTEAARFTSAGNLRFPSGQGIDFSATSDGGTTTPSELLDDYEEGTWTPNFTNVTYTPTTQFGKYTKIGRYVYCTIAIRGSISSGSGNIGLEGLPFSAADTGDTEQRSCWHPANGGHMIGLLINDARFRVSGSNMQGVKGATGSTTYMTGNQLTSGTFEFTGDFSYYTSS